MATTSSPKPMLFSVLTTSHENDDDLVGQLRNHLAQIETNVQQTLNKIQQRKPFSAISTNHNQSDPQIRNQFFHVLKDVAVKNNLPFDEPLFRQQILEKHDSSPKVDILRDKPSVTASANDQHLSPMTNARRSQFAPVLSSTPVHQISPITPIPVDLTLATPSVAPVLTIHSNDLPAGPPSAIVPQRAHIGRPPRIPRSESATLQKKNPSPITEQQEEVALAQEICVSSKRRVKTKQEIIEDHVEMIIEQQHEIMTDVVKEVQSTPLRGRKKKVVQEDVQPIPQLKPPPPPAPPAPIPEPENEIIPKKTRGGRGKKKEEQEEVKPARTASARGRKKQEEAEEAPAPLPKKPTRGKKLIEPIVNTEENPPPKVRATPSRGKKKSPVENPEPIIPSTPKKSTTTRSKKRKGNEDTNENALESIQPPSPKRRGGRNTKSKNSSPVEVVAILPVVEPPAPPQLQPPPSARSSRRAKKEVEIPVEKQEEIVLNKKPRTGRGKKNAEPSNTKPPLTMVDVVLTSITISAPTSIDSLVAKPPRPPVARKKKSLAMPPFPQTSPSTPPSTQRIQSTSPIQEKALLPLPIPRSAGRRRRAANSSPRTDEGSLETVSSMNRNPKRTHSNVITTPKRVRRDNLLVTAIPSTPGKKRQRCTCEKRRNKICDICVAAIDD